MTCPYPPIPECLPSGTPTPADLVLTGAGPDALGLIVVVVMLALAAGSLFWLSRRG